MNNLKEIFRNYIRGPATLAAFGLALTILSAAFLAYQLIRMGYPEFAGMAAVIDGIVVGLYTAILLIRQRREDMVQKQLAILMGEYDSPDNVSRLRHYITELESELAAISELRQPTKKAPALQPDKQPSYECV